MPTWIGCSGPGIWNRTRRSERVKILVTGGGGFAGRHLIRELGHLENDGIAATVLGPVPEFDPVSEPILASVDWMSMDATSTESVREVVERSAPDQVYHLAGQASVGESFAAPVRTWEINATGTVRLLHALASRSRSPARVLMVSSAEVYGDVAPGEQPIRADRALEPATPYGASKAAAELVCQQATRSGAVEVVIARSFNHIGPGQDERFVLASLAAQLVRIARGEEESRVRVGNLEVRRDFLDVRDVVRGYLLLMAEGRPGAAYNICSGVARTLHAVAQRLLELSGTGAKLEIDPERMRSVDIPLLVGDAAEIEALGWRPTYELDQTLRDILAEASGRS